MWRLRCSSRTVGQWLLLAQLMLLLLLRLILTDSDVAQHTHTGEWQGGHCGVATVAVAVQRRNAAADKLLRCAQRRAVSAAVAVLHLQTKLN